MNKKETFMTAEDWLLNIFHEYIKNTIETKLTDNLKQQTN